MSPSTLNPFALRDIYSYLHVRITVTGASSIRNFYGVVYRSAERRCIVTLKSRKILLRRVDTIYRHAYMRDVFLFFFFPSLLSSACARYKS